MASPNYKKSKKAKKNQDSSHEHDLSKSLIACTKSGDVVGAISLFDSAAAAGSRLSAHHYNHLLHLLSTSPSSTSAAAGRRVFDHMVASGTVPTEATITAMARITTTSDGGGDEAFELIKCMAAKYGASPRLRTYGPALAAFRRGGEAEKAYAIEAHMAASGVAPEEPEVVSFLDISAKAGKVEKVYEYLQKLRNLVDHVSESTAEVLEGWFESEKAAEVGIPSWDEHRVKDAILMNGGGWHGLGWLGSGKWEVKKAQVGTDGRCENCSCRLACVDIGRVEMKRFADSVAALALERETKANFSRFQVDNMLYCFKAAKIEELCMDCVLSNFVLLNFVGMVGKT